MNEVLSKVYIVLLDPKWIWGTLIFDNKNLIFLSLAHPEHGVITSLIPKDVAKSMGEALLQLSK